MRKLTKTAIILVAVLAYGSSCKKDKELAQEEEIKTDTVKLPDHIVYQELNEGIASVRAWTTPDPFGALFPVPEDSTSGKILIDLDKDGTSDFFLQASHVPQGVYCGPHQPSKIFNVKIEGINQNDFIEVDDVGPGFPVKYDTTVVLNGNGKWSHSTSLSLYGCWVTYTTTLKDTCIAVKTNNKLGWIHVLPNSHNGVIVKEFAINTTSGNSIRVGQKE